MARVLKWELSRTPWFSGDSSKDGRLAPCYVSSLREQNFTSTFESCILERDRDLDKVSFSSYDRASV